MSEESPQVGGREIGGTLLGCLAVLLLLALGVAAVLLCYHTVAWAIDTTFQAMESKNWPTTTGRITSSKGDLVAEDTMITPGSKVYVVVARISYEYSVDGKGYTSKTVSYLGLERMSGEAEKLIEDYPEGREVKVYYCPSDPEKACLIPGWGVGSLMPWALVLVICSGTIGWFLYGLGMASEDVQVTMLLPVICFLVLLLVTVGGWFLFYRNFRRSFLAELTATMGIVEIAWTLIMGSLATILAAKGNLSARAILWCLFPVWIVVLVVILWIG